MQTQTHFLITAALGHLGRRRTALPIHTKALLLGSFLPDIPFALISLVYAAYYTWILPPEQSGGLHNFLHADLFYTDPVWIIGHNTLHSLVVLATLALLGKLAEQRGRGWGRALLWFAIGAAFHTVIDIFTHHSDGPLFLFPLNWSYRFPSPFSYWEDAYHADAVSMLEYLLSGLSLLYLAVSWWLARRRKQHPRLNPD